MERSERTGAVDLKFGPARRLVRPAEFLRVKEEGRVQRGKLFFIGVLEVADELRFRAGFVTSKRVGGAVVRNRVRRRLREIVRQHQHTLRPGIWFVVIARSAAAHASHAALKDEWLRVARRALILPPPCCPSSGF
ncbi:hypothetical protein BH18VER1_BH18VER1_11280 [soil metagenome]